MTAASLHRKVTAAAILAALLIAGTFGVIASAFDGGPSAGAVISNRAEAVYTDEAGTTFSTVSPTITVTILAVSTLTVTPDETQPSANVSPNETVTRLFRVCNAGNITDLYTITLAEVNSPSRITALYFDTDSSGTVTTGDAPVTLNQSLSPRVSPGSCVGVLAVVEVGDAAPQSNLNIRLAARSNVVDAVNGRGEDQGTIINVVGNGARLTSPDNPSMPPSKLVNGKAQTTVSPGTPFTYTVSFRNSGDVTARDVLWTDDLPTGVEYVPSSLKLEERDLTDAEDADQGTLRGRRLEVRLAEVAPGQVVRISFRARMTGEAPAGVGIRNTAAVTASNAPAAQSTQAVTIVDPFGVVYSGRGGAAAPVSGARVEILLDQAGLTRLQTPSGSGFSPNQANDNPFVTDTQGHFNFTLSADQLGTDAAPARYFIRVTADGYITRMLEVTLAPAGAGLFRMLVSALDGQPIARAGGFDLVSEPVEITDLAAIALNIPMFEQRGLEINKSVDKPRAEIGDTLTYSVELNNPTAAPYKDVVVRDRMPDSFHYAQGTGRVTTGNALDNPVEPELSGGELIFRIGTIPQGSVVRLTYRVRVGANAHEGRQENTAVATGFTSSGERFETQPARASVMVGGGAFSTRQVLVGRVYEDVNANGTFDSGDQPMAGVRLFLNSGQSVITDSQGLYNFPSLGDGPQVISLDPVSLPQGYALTDGGTLSGRSWTRLLRTPLGGGSLLRQNFALVRKGGAGLPLAESGAQEGKAMSATAPVEKVTAVASEARKAGGNGQASGTPATPMAAGTYEMTTDETVAPVAPGSVLVLAPAADSVVMSPAMQLEARVALGWTVQLEVNGQKVSEQNIGTSRLDQKNNVSTYTFVGVSLKPGPNRVKVTPVGSDGKAGKASEMTVMGRGPVRRLEVVPEGKEIQTGGRDGVTVRVRAFDQWNNPAADDQVALETSAGKLFKLAEVGREKPRAARPEGASDVAAGLREDDQSQNKVVLQLEGGEGVVKLVGSGDAGEAQLRALSGQSEAKASVRITPELRPTIMVGLAEVSVGKAVPEVSLRGEEGNYRSRVSFFYQGRVLGDNMLTLAYDSQRPINRTAGRDRMFQMDPLDRVYPLFGDSSTRFEAAASNSKLYARVDRKRSYLMFGDYDAEMSDLALAGYGRKLTGVKLHLENSDGDTVVLTGARPDTAFARDVFPAGSLSLMRLSHAEILPGSETVAIEVRDRRNPENILSRETLIRSVDYNLNPATGELFMLRYISTFDYQLNLVQVVATYEHRADSMGSAVYTGRARKNFAGIGLKLGLSAVMQREQDFGNFFLAGIDGEKTLPNRGTLSFAYARSQGEFMSARDQFSLNADGHDGDAYRVELNQPLPFYQGVLRARYSNASAGFFNPFGATVTPGSRRAEVSLEFKPTAKSLLRLGYMNERNRTASVDNSRNTFSASWDQMLTDRLRFHVGYDRRSYEDAGAGRSVDSNLVTASIEAKITDKLEVSVKREQNLGEADPTYPNQTTFAARYQYNSWTKFFLTQRLASAPIRPIGDFSQAGFAYSGARRETAVGVESRFGKYTNVSGRYQLENGINGTDSFAVIGLQNRLPVSSELQLELGFERGFHLAGEGTSFNSATIGLGWQPAEDFRASARYEFRDRGGLGQLFALGAAGRLGDGITTMARFQYSRSGFEGHDASSMEATAALAIRPLESDRAGLLFSYTHRSLEQEGFGGTGTTRDRLDSLAADGYYQATRDLELYGRFALRLNANGQDSLPFVSTFTYLAQGRLQYRLTRRFDWAGEARLLMQPSSGTSRSVYGTELGFWAIPDLRLGVGYNFTLSGEPSGSTLSPARRGFYFTISSKLSNLFDLFGTNKAGLAGAQGDQQGANEEKR